MSIVKVNKNGFDTLSSSLRDKVSDLDGEISRSTSTLNSIPSHEDFPSLTSKASMIAGNLEELNTDFNYLSKNIETYFNTLRDIDSEGFDTSAEALAKYNNANTSTNVKTSTNNAVNLVYRNTNKGNYSYSYSTGPTGTRTSSGLSYSNEVGTLVFTTTVGSSVTGIVSRDKLIEMGQIIETEEGTEIKVPKGLGSVHTYMGWQCITARDSMQWKLIESAGMNFDEEGFGKIGDRYVVAVTETFGKVGDYIDVYKEDGTVIKCIIGDIKGFSDPGCNEWGHNNGENVIEFIVDKNTWYNGNSGGHVNPGTPTCHPEWNQNITKIVNLGNYFDLLDDVEIVTI